MLEREMQDMFFEDIQSLTKRNKSFDWFQEVGNHDSFFRADIVSYGKNDMECYELKMKSCEKLAHQLSDHFIEKRFTRIYAVLPLGQAIKFDAYLKRLKADCVDSIYVLGYDTDIREIKQIKKGKQLEQNKYSKINIMDLIIRGYHLEGKFRRKHYK